MSKLIRLDSTGLRVSISGVPVESASIMQLLFSSNFQSPRLIKKDSFTSTPLQTGQEERITSVAYPIAVQGHPFVIAVAKAVNHDVTMLGGTQAFTPDQYTYLDNLYSTFAVEYPGANPTTLYSSSRVIRRGTTSAPLANAGAANVPTTFASYKFLARVYGNRVDFAINCGSDVKVKYAILDSRI